MDNVHEQNNWVLCKCCTDVTTGFPYYHEKLPRLYGPFSSWIFVKMYGKNVPKYRKKSLASSITTVYNQNIDCEHWVEIPRILETWGQLALAQYSEYETNGSNLMQTCPFCVSTGPQSMYQ